MAGSHVVALGAGTIILLVMWISAIFLWLFLYRSQNAARFMIIFAVSVISLVLILLPTDSAKTEDIPKVEDDDTYYDYMFIWKGFLIFLLAISVVVGAALDISQYWTMVVRGSKPVPKRNSRLKQD